MTTIYTDGSCLKNPGAGGWAFILTDDDNQYEISDLKHSTTNNEMELTAVIKALHFIQTENIVNKTCKITIYSDSQYVVNGINKWIYNWLKTPTKSSKRPNWNLWYELYQLRTSLEESYEVNFEWVKAHSTNHMNNRVDRIARERALEC